MFKIQDRINSRRWLSTAVFVLVFMLLALFLGQVSAVDDPDQLVPLWTASVKLQAGVYETAGGRYAVIKLARDLRRAEMDALSGEGVRLLSYLGDGAYIAGIDPGALTADVSATYGVESAAPWRLENKATSALRQGIVPEAARMEAGYLRLNVLFFADVSQSEIEAILGRHAEAFEVESPPLLWEVEIEPARLDGLLREQAIHVVEPAMPSDLLVDQARALIHVDEVQQAVITSPPAIHYDGLTGKGVTLQVSESVWDGHPDFQDENGKSRFVSPSPGWGDDHGTGTAGIMGGNGKLSASLQDTPYYAEIGRWRGVAPEVMLYEGHYYGGQGHLVDASNHSKTMSAAYDTGYGSTAASVDRQVRGDSGTDLRWPQIWAAGNNGYVVMHDDEVGYYSIYSPAKNNVVVGAVNANDGSLSTKVSSLGPTFDGRIKPDVMAPGSKNHLPREFNIYEDKIQMSIDYIRVINERTGSIDARWEFNTDGDPEGWFQTTEDTCQISGLTASGGYLNFEIGYVPTEKCGDFGYGYNRVVDFESDPDQVVVMRYKAQSPAGPLTAGGRFGWGWEDNADPDSPGNGKIRFPSVANDQWVDVTIPVGRWGQTSTVKFGVVFGGWKGRIFALGMTPLYDIDPQIVTLFYDDSTQTYAYAEGQGTSEAAPMVTGSVALILQQFREQFEIDLAADPPLPSTIKAILIQTADDMVHETSYPRDVNNPDTGAPVLYYKGPDFATGYGLVNTRAAVDFIAEDPGPGATARLLHENELDSYQRHVYEIWLTDNDIARLNGQLKFTLAWDDFPGDPTLASTTPKLVNDLDLHLIGPDGTTHLPWTLDPLPVNDCGGKKLDCGGLDPIKPDDVKPARRAVDHLNNVEMVQVDRVTPGQWLVVVNTYKMPMPMQSYSLVGNQPTQFVQKSDDTATALVSVDSAGNEGNGASDRPAISADGRFVAFMSGADNLVEGDTNEWDDIFVHDRQTGETARVSVDSHGNEGNDDSDSPTISADGRFVAFESLSDFDTECESGYWRFRVFLHDRDADEDGIFDENEKGALKTTCVSQAFDGGDGDLESRSPAISGDGRYVAFDSTSSNLVPGDTQLCETDIHGTISCSDIFVRDRLTGKTTRVSVDSYGNQGNNSSWGSAISTNGRFVAFHSLASNLVPGDTQLCEDWDSGKYNCGDVFLHDRDWDEDGVYDETGAVRTTRVSVDSNGNQGNDTSWFPAISGNGRFIAFESDAGNLVTGDTNEKPDIFVHDRVTGQTTRVSMDSNGNQGNDISWFPAISGNGRFVAFESDASNLVTGDTNEQSDIFVHDRDTGRTIRVSVGSNGNQANDWSESPAISAGGQQLYVVFTSRASNLVQHDTNNEGDVFVHQLSLSLTGNPEPIISAGESHTCGLRIDGSAECWGAAFATAAQTQAIEQNGPFIQIGAGAAHSCGLRSDGSVDCWGSNSHGQAKDQAGPFVQISVGAEHNCGLKRDGSVKCWGRNNKGQAENQAGPFVQIGAGWQHSCGLTAGGSIDCWGSNAQGEAADEIGPFAQVSVGWGHTCGLTTDGQARCWGRNDDGQAQDQAGPFKQISAGGRHTCGLKYDGSVHCWGFNSDGQAEDQPGPYRQVTAGGTWRSGTNRPGHTCGLRLDGSVHCWGSNGDGQAEDRSGPFGPAIKLIESYAVSSVIEGKRVSRACYWINSTFPLSGDVNIEIAPQNDQVKLNVSSVTLDSLNWERRETRGSNFVCIRALDDVIDDGGEQVCKDGTSDIFGTSPPGSAYQECGDHQDFVAHTIVSSSDLLVGKGTWFVSNNQTTDLDDDPSTVDVLVADNEGGSEPVANLRREPYELMLPFVTR